MHQYRSNTCKGKELAVESQLPEAIIHHIQSFLNGKEAAQTTLFSKSWYNAWLTRPNLDFDQNYFAKKSYNDKCSARFWGFANNTMQRYETLNLKVKSLRLWIKGSYDATPNTYSLVNKLIVKAMKMGVTDLDFKIHDLNREFALPHEAQNRKFTLPHEVFRSKSLIRLSISGCQIGKETDEKISCSSLQHLTLDKVRVEDNPLIEDIVSSCPLIENLSASSFIGIRPVWSVFNGFYNLQNLMFDRVRVPSRYFENFSSKFPCMKDLTLYGCHGYKVLQISSPSLERINIKECVDKTITMKFDVPKVHKLTLSVFKIPSMSFRTTTRSWESHISIERQEDNTDSTWFMKLNKLLQTLSLSKVSLSLEMLSNKSLHCAVKSYGIPKPEVEKLTIYMLHSICSAFFCSLFHYCRPIYVTQHLSPKSQKGAQKIVEYFYYEMGMQEACLHSCFAYQSMSGGYDLKEISVEFYDEAVLAWRPRMLNTSARQGIEEQRLHLGWGR